MKEYVNNLSGSIELISKEGDGTTFMIHIPFPKTKRSNLDKNDISNPSDPYTGEKPVLLVVEDHSDLNDFICEFFKKQFYCIPVYNGEEALDKMKLIIPDIIITDIMMPKMDGPTLVKNIKLNDQYAHIPIIALTAIEETERKVELYTSGVDNYLIKPFDNQELKAVVENILLQQKKRIHKFHQLFLAERDIKSITGVLENEPVDSSKEFILQQLDKNDLSILQIVTHLGTSRKKFQKEIKEITGLTPVEFVRSIRLNEAKKLLIENQLTVSEVAYSVGFNNLSYFTRSFKNEFNILPSDYKEKSIL